MARDDARRGEIIGIRHQPRQRSVSDRKRPGHGERRQREFAVPAQLGAARRLSDECVRSLPGIQCRQRREFDRQAVHTIAVALPLILEVQAPIGHGKTADRNTQRLRRTRAPGVGHERGQVQPAVLRDFQARRRIDQPHFVQHPGAKQERTPFEVDHGVDEPEHRPALHGLHREFARLQPERERVEADCADARTVMQLFLDKARQLAPGDPRDEQESRERIDYGKGGRDERDEQPPARERFRSGLPAHRRGTLCNRQRVVVPRLKSNAIVNVNLRKRAQQLPVRPR